MAVNEEERFRLQHRLREVLGVPEAGTLMEYLPPVGWADVATKRDLDHLRLATKAEVADLRTDLTTEIGDLRTELRTGIADLRTELRTGIGDLRTELRTSASGLRAEMRDQFRAQTWRMVGLFLPALLGLAALVVTQPHL